MPAPSEIPDWATDAAYPADGGPSAGLPNKVASSPTRRARGWRPRQKQPAPGLNYWMNLVGKWIRHIATETVDLVGLNVLGNLNVNGNIVADGSIEAGSDFYADGHIYFGNYRFKTYGFRGAFISSAGSLSNGVDNGPAHGAGHIPYWELTATSTMRLPIDGLESGMRLHRVRVIADIDLAGTTVTFNHYGQFANIVGDQGTMVASSGTTAEGYMYYDFDINFPFDIDEGTLAILRITTGANAVRFRKVVVMYSRPAPP